MYISNSSVQTQRFATYNTETNVTELTEVESAGEPGVQQLSDTELQQQAQQNGFDYRKQALMNRQVSDLYQDRVTTSSTSTVQNADDTVQSHSQSATLERMAQSLVDESLLVRQVRQRTNNTVNLVGVAIVHESMIETHDTLALTSTGQVQTDDGRQIDFAMGLDFERNALHKTTSSFIGNRNLIDPLMLNLNGDAISLSDKQFSFDLDADGTEEQLNRPAAGTGYVVFDHNANGIIDDGSEMFGPQSGSGFADLSELDEDGNGWIDEADSAFASLQIMTFNGDEVQLSSLYDVEVGALYTGSQAAGYDIMADDGQLLGEVAHSSMALSESGKALYLQEFHYATSQSEDVSEFSSDPLSPFRGNIMILSERDETVVSVSTIEAKSEMAEVAANTLSQTVAVEETTAEEPAVFSIHQMQQAALSNFLSNTIASAPVREPRQTLETTQLNFTTESHSPAALKDNALVNDAEFKSDRWQVLLKILTDMREQRLATQKQWQDADEYRQIQHL